MSWNNIRLIFHREVRDQLRDRRTLFMIAVLPILLYPALGIGMVQMLVIFTEQPRTVVLLGEENLPEGLLKDNKFDNSLFDMAGEGNKLHVVTESSLKTGRIDKDQSNSDLKKTDSNDDESLLSQAKELQRLYLLIEQSGHKSNKIVDHQTDSQMFASNGLDSLKLKLSNAFIASGINVLVIIPPGFKSEWENINLLLQKHQIDSEYSVPLVRPVILHNSAKEKSQIAFRRVSQAMQNWEDRLLGQRLQQANLPEIIVSPVNLKKYDLAQDDERSATLWSKLFPALLVIMTVTGAFYPAIDVCAGEKERGTMETLLICPASRIEIVLGKFFTIFLFSVSTAFLNLCSMGFTGKYMASVSGGAVTRFGNIAPPSMTALIWVGLLMIPLATLFSALCLALSTFAKSSKEGQYYLTPLLMVVLGLTVFCLSPAVEITPFYSVLPVVGPALLLKNMMAANVDGVALLYSVPVLGTSICYSLMALWWAIDQFSREEVLFREAERFELKAWIQHLLRDKEPIPSFSESAFCFILIMLTQFGTMNVMRNALNSGAFRADQLLMIQQLVMLATPALMMGLLLTTSARKTFRLSIPRFPFWVIAAGLAITLHPLSVELIGQLGWFFPKLPESVTRQFAELLKSDMPLWRTILAVAITPAICEELAFRGFILSGFHQRGRTWLAIGFSSLLFGLMHMIPQQVFNASLLGLVLGLIALRGNSLYPCILFHAMYNSLNVLRTRSNILEMLPASNSMFNNFFQITREAGSPVELRYEWPLLLLCGLISAGMIFWLVKQSCHQTGTAEELRET